MKISYTYRVYPTASQQIALAQVFGCVRYVYNWALTEREAAYKRGETVGYNGSSAALTALKKTPEHSWLKDVSCVPTQQCLRHLQTAYTNFFAKRSRKPAFKSKRGKQSAEFVGKGFIYRDGVLSLAKIGPLKVRWSRRFQSEPTTVTISKTPAGRYFVSLQLDEPLRSYAPTGEAVGVDLGIKQLATLSTGEIIVNPRYTKKYEKRLAKAQRILSRRIKDSGRWNRQRIKFARIHERLTNARKDHLDKVTTDLVRRFDTIAVEDLHVKGILKNHKLAKHIADASFGTFRQMLTYKCEWRGKKLVVINRFYASSKLCSNCGSKLSVLPLRVRQWQCPSCETNHDRDHNAAKNILSQAVGQTVSAHGATIRPFTDSVQIGQLR